MSEKHFLYLSYMHLLVGVSLVVAHMWGYIVEDRLLLFLLWFFCGLYPLAYHIAFVSPHLYRFIDRNAAINIRNEAVKLASMA